MEVLMSLITFIIGLLAGIIAGMIMVAGSWRKALGKLGSYAITAANAPAAHAAPQTVKPLATPAPLSEAASPVPPGRP
jgi:hypothetical protein